MKDERLIWTILVVFAMVAAGFVAWVISNSLPSIETFAAISVGMSQQQVLHLVGEPNRRLSRERIRAGDKGYLAIAEAARMPLLREADEVWVWGLHRHCVVAFDHSSRVMGKWGEPGFD